MSYIHLMKILYCIICILATCLLFPNQLNAQAYRNTQGEERLTEFKKRKKIKEREYKDNILKINLTSLIFKSAALQYERKIARKKTFALGLIYRPSSEFIVYKFLDTASGIAISQEARDMYGTAKLRSIMITPELRHYFSKQAPKGLYLALFARGRFDQTPFSFTYYEDNNAQEKTGKAILNERYIGGGLMLGLQLVTRKQLSIDFWFIGPWVYTKQTHLTSKLNTARISELQQKFISEDMKYLVENGNTKNAHEVKWNDKGIDTKFNTWFFSSRFLGVNIGYSF